MRRFLSQSAPDAALLTLSLALLCLAVGCGTPRSTTSEEAPAESSSAPSSASDAADMAPSAPPPAPSGTVEGTGSVSAAPSFTAPAERDVAFSGDGEARREASADLEAAEEAGGVRERVADAEVTAGADTDGERHYDPWDPQAGLLTAGDVDDHLNFAHYLRYVQRASRYDRSLPALDLADRVTVHVEDRSGQPVSNARVRITLVGSQRPPLDLVSGTDGRLAFFPSLEAGRNTRRFRVEATAPDGQTTSRVTTLDLERTQGETTLLLTLPVRGRATRPDALDLAIVLDVTGSMGDEHAYLTEELESIVGRVRRRFPQADLRFGLVAYRDHGDEFVVRSYPFTSSVAQMQRRLEEQEANGGGDWPEAVDEALDAALELDWRGGRTARMVLLVADAPPHDDRMEAVLDRVMEARQAGIRIYPVAASGATGPAEYVMRAAAVLTQGRHLFLTDDSGVGLSHDEPDIPCYVVTRLDGLLVRAIEGELAGERVEPGPREVIREVGAYRGGVCEDEPITYVPPGQR